MGVFALGLVFVGSMTALVNFESVSDIWVAFCFWLVNGILVLVNLLVFVGPLVCFGEISNSVARLFTRCCFSVVYLFVAQTMLRPYLPTKQKFVDLLKKKTDLPFHESNNTDSDTASDSVAASDRDAVVEAVEEVRPPYLTKAAWLIQLFQWQAWV